MKTILKKLSLLSLAMFCMSAAVRAQPLLINEIEIDPPSTISDACQYTEIRGTPGATVAPNTYFLSVNSDAGNFGFANQAIDLGGRVVGSNGTITLVNDLSGACPNRVFPAETTVVTFTSALFIGQPSETYLIAQSTASLISGQDLDVNDDGLFDAGLGITVLDGFALLINPEEEYVYGANAGVVNISNTTSIDQPDAVTRFPGNSTPFSANAFFFGELAASPDETTTYAAPFSQNFPGGGALTPGAPNSGSPLFDAPVDFNGDGRTDYSVVRAAGGAGSQLTWHTQLAGGNPIATRDWGISGDIILSGDYDGDGRDDVTVYRPATGSFYIINSATLTIRIERLGQPGDDPRIVGDYDGDGRDDPAVYRSGAQSFWYYRTANSTYFSSVEWGEEGDVPAPGDYDGDGRADFVVHRAEGDVGQFWKRLSGGTFNTEVFGQANDTVVPGDYDGDGKTDLAVTRLAGGSYVWEFEPSGTAGSSVVSATWGVPGDVIAQGDYDGDGKTDYAIWRPGTQGRFYMMTTGTGTITTKDWGRTGDVPVAGYNSF